MLKAPKILALPYENSAVGVIYGTPKKNGDSTFIADCQLEQANDHQTKAELARTDFIVLACNSHYDQLAEIQRLKNALQEIATYTLWGEVMKDEAMRKEYQENGEYDSEDGFNPSCDTESTMLRECVEVARKALGMEV